MAILREAGGEGCEFDEMSDEQRRLVERLSLAAIEATRTQTDLKPGSYFEAMKAASDEIQQLREEVERLRCEAIAQHVPVNLQGRPPSPIKKGSYK